MTHRGIKTILKGMASLTPTSSPETNRWICAFAGSKVGVFLRYPNRSWGLADRACADGAQNLLMCPKSTEGGTRA